MEEELFLPTLDYWRHGNTWSGSKGVLRFWVTPGEDGFAVEVWRGPMSREFRDEAEEIAFPLTEEGLSQMRTWLLNRAKDMNANGEKE